MSFTNAFEKVAKGKAPKGVWDTASKVVKEIGSHGKKFLSGLESAGKESLSDTLKLRGITEPLTAAHEKTKGKMFGGIKNRGITAEAIGKTAPKALALGAYGLGAKKVYDATLGGSKDSTTNNYYGGY